MFYSKLTVHMLHIIFNSAFSFLFTVPYLKKETEELEKELERISGKGSPDICLGMGFCLLLFWGICCCCCWFGVYLNTISRDIYSLQSPEDARQADWFWFFVAFPTPCFCFLDHAHRYGQVNSPGLAKYIFQEKVGGVKKGMSHFFLLLMLFCHFSDSYVNGD